MTYNDFPAEDRRAEAEFLRECAIRLDAAEREDPGRGYARRAEIKRRLAEELEPEQEGEGVSIFDVTDKEVSQAMREASTGTGMVLQALESALEGMADDLNEAHTELMRAHGLTEAQAANHDWPEWSGPANSIRWAEKLLGRKLAKTDIWSLYPEEKTR